MRLERVRNRADVYTFRRNDGTNTVRMRCSAVSRVYDADKSRRLDLDVSLFAEEVRNIETFVSERLCRPVVYGGVCPATNLLRGVKIPCKYGHVMIPVTDHEERRITTFDIDTDDALEVVMELKTVWCAEALCGLSWVLQSIKKTGKHNVNTPEHVGS